MGSYRSKLDIIAAILRVASQNAKKTQIMYQANLSYKLLTKYLSETIEASLLRFERKNRRYVVTTKGHMFLEKYREYSRHNNHIEKQLNNIRNKRKALEELCFNNQ